MAGLERLKVALTDQEKADLDDTNLELREQVQAALDQVKRFDLGIRVQLKRTHSFVMTCINVGIIMHTSYI